MVQRKQGSVVEKVLGMHMIKLHPGVKEEDSEKFVTEEVNPLPLFEDWKAYSDFQMGRRLRPSVAGLLQEY